VRGDDPDDNRGGNRRKRNGCFGRQRTGKSSNRQVLSDETEACGNFKGFLAMR
jgi:hypothetical protein